MMLPCDWMKKKSDGTPTKLWEVLSALEGLPYSELKKILATYLYDKDYTRVKWIVSVPVIINYIVTAIINRSISNIDEIRYKLDYEDFPHFDSWHRRIFYAACFTNLYLLLLEIIKIVHIRSDYLRLLRQDGITQAKVIALVSQIYLLWENRYDRNLNKTQLVNLTTICLVIVTLATLMRMSETLRSQFLTIKEIFGLTKGVFGVFFLLIIAFTTLFFMN